MNPPLLVAIVGPTGSGKSDLGLFLAREFQGEIVNCDSMQLYRGLDVGTAKLPFDKRQGIPHHLIDVAEPAVFFSAGEFTRLARAVVIEIRRRGRLAVVVGGTGLYLRALLEGLFEGPSRSEALRARLNRLIARGRLGRLHQWLGRIDPESAARIAGRDAPRIVRALEVYLLTGRPLSSHFRDASNTGLEGFRMLKLGLNPPRAELYERTDARVLDMMDHGFIEEVRGLLRSGLSADCHAFSALGYRRVAAYVRGEGDLRQLIAAVQTDTRHYAKRQWTWFRRDPEVRWLDGFGGDPGVQTTASAWVRNAL